MNAHDSYDVQDVSAEIALRLKGLDPYDPDTWDAHLPPESEDESQNAKPWNFITEPLPDLAALPEDNDFPDFKWGLHRQVFDLRERMIGLTHKREDPKPTVDRMRLCLHSAHMLFKVDRFVLQQLGMHRVDAAVLSTIPDLGRYVTCLSYGEHPQVGCLELASDFVAAHFIGLKDELLYMFCINARGGLKEKVLLHQGVEDRALFSMNKMILEILRHRPSAIIIAHNHPGGTLRPSQDDILCTQDIIGALTPMGVPLLDHIVVGGRTAVSMRENGFIPECVWMRQSPKHYLLRNWLLPPKPKKPRKPKVLTPEQQAAAQEKALRAERRFWLRQISLARTEIRRCKEKSEKAMRLYRVMQAKEAAYQRTHPEEFPPKKD